MKTGSSENIHLLKTCVVAKMVRSKYIPLNFIYFEPVEHELYTKYF